MIFRLLLLTAALVGAGSAVVLQSRGDADAPATPAAAATTADHPAPVASSPHGGVVAPRGARGGRTT